MQSIIGDNIISARNTDITDLCAHAETSLDSDGPLKASNALQRNQMMGGLFGHHRLSFSPRRTSEHVCCAQVLWEPQGLRETQATLVPKAGFPLYIAPLR